jgi:hypothetical protein
VGHSGKKETESLGVAVVDDYVRHFYGFVCTNAD